MSSCARSNVDSRNLTLVYPRIYNERGKDFDSPASIAPIIQAHYDNHLRFDWQILTASSRPAGVFQFRACRKQENGYFFAGHQASLV